jgi:tetratricopeptide (TPR) repeat protein
VAIPGNTASPLSNAVAYLNAKCFAEAEPLLNQLLNEAPDNPDILGWLAITSQELGQTERAISLWQRMLALPIRPSLYLATLHNLLQTIFINHGEAKAKETARQYTFPDWPVERIPNDHVSGELVKFIDLLIDLEQVEPAQRLLKNLLISRPGDGAFLLTLGKAQMAANKPDDAWQTLRAAETALRGQDTLPLLGALYQCARMRSDETTTRAIAKRACRLAPLFVYPACPTQRGRILILNGEPNLNADTKTESQLHSGGNYPSQLPDRLGEDFQFATVSVVDEESRGAARSFAPDLVINNYTNAELILADGRLEEIAAFADSFGVPVINHPKRAVLTTRENMANLLKDIPGLRMPKTIRFDKTKYSLEEMFDKVEAAFTYPFITRHVSFQVGAGMTKVEDRAGLINALAYWTGKEFLVTEFIDTRGSDNRYRKFRAVSIKGVIHYHHVFYSREWKVHAPKTTEDRALQVQVGTREQFHANPKELLGESAMHALQVIAKRVPLDIFGIDFDVDMGGYLVLYEANAMMQFLFPPLNDSSNTLRDVAMERMASEVRTYFQSQMDESNKLTQALFSS